MSATVRDVAAVAGVSAATVSRALHGHRSISEATRRKVEQAAAELGYTLPMAVTDRSRVAVVMPYLDRWYFAQVLDGVERTFADRNILVVIQRLIGLDDRRRALLGDVPRREADGVLLVNVPPAHDEVQLLVERHVPLVLLGATMPGVPSVEIDDVAAARGATLHLMRLGHRRIGLLSGRPFERIPFTAPPERRRGFLLAHKDAALPWDPGLEATGDFTVRGAMRAAVALLDRPDPPTGIFAESDEMAFAVLAVARSLGLRVPEDLSVVGFDDHDLSESLGLTTVAQPVRTLGELAALQLAGLLGGPHGQHDAPPARAGQTARAAQPTHRVMVPTMMVVRTSTAAPRPHSRGVR